MTTFISILRGINLGSRNSIKMDTLKLLLAESGLQSVQTYIQSGNCVYQSVETDSNKLNELIKNGIQTQFGFDIPVITLTLEELQEIISKNPFLDKDEKSLHVTFLSDIPKVDLVDKLNQWSYLPDEFSIIENAVYLHCPNGYGNTKLSNKFLETKLKVTATTRNWKTTNELLSMAIKL